MDNLFILMCVYLTYTVVSFWLFNCNFLSPSFVFSTSLSAMLCLAYYAATNMEMLFAINLQTFTIFAVAGFIFLATEFLVYAFHTVSHFQNKPLKNSIENPQPLIINWQIQWLSAAFLAVSLVLAVAVLYINTSGSWSQRMSEYRDMFLYNREKIRFLFIVSQIYKIHFVLMNLFSYILIYNTSVCKRPLKDSFVYIIYVSLHIVYGAISNGARQTAVEEILVLSMVYITLNSQPEQKKKLWIFLFKSLPILIILASFFTYAGTFVGRAETQKSGLQNLVEYICGGLYAFNNNLDKAASTEIWGQASFSYTYAIPQNMGLIPRSDDSMVTASFELYGNTYTIFGRWYRDFGTPGVFVMTCLVSLFFSLMFYKKIIISSNRPREHHFARIFYCNFMTSLVWAAYDDRIGYLITMQTLVFLILTKILFELLITRKFKLF